MFLYISTFEDLESAPGIEKKIRGQVKAIQAVFGQYALIYTRGKDIYFEGKLKEDTEYQKIAIGRVKNVVSKITYYKKVLDFLMENMTINPNTYHRVAYIRFSLADSYLLRIIDFLKSNHWKVVLEIPTYSFISEWKQAGIKGLYKRLTFRLMGMTLLKKVDSIVSIGSKPVIPFFAELCSEKTIVISNGIDVDSIPFSVERNDKNKGVLNLVGVANVAPWHGYDRVIKGLELFYKCNPSPSLKVVFHVVGEGPSSSKLRELVKIKGLENIVSFHGIRVGQELEYIFSNADIAVGSLALHRTGGGNPLKNREYCARGIPFIYAGDDPGFPKEFPFALRISSNDSPVSIEEVLEFYKYLVLRFPDYKLQMRRYAEEHFSWDKIMKKVMDSVIRGDG